MRKLKVIECFYCGKKLPSPPSRESVCVHLGDETRYYCWECWLSNFVKDVFEALKQGKMGQREALVEIDERVIHSKIKEELIKFLADPDEGVRFIAVCCLGRADAWRRRKIPIIDIVDNLIRVLRHDSCEKVRSAAASALGKLGDPCARYALADALIDPSRVVRDAALDALREMKKVFEETRTTNLTLKTNET